MKTITKKQSSVVKELERIRRHNPDGILLPEAVVEAARNPRSPLHSKFTWDDTEAAHQYRLWQARTLIRVLVTVETREDAEPRRVFVSLSGDRYAHGGYRTLTSVLKDDDQREMLLADARKDMLLFKEKYSRLKELARVIEAMEETLGR